MYVYKKSIKFSGLVTTTRITHASPAGLYAHTSERNWESDADVPEECLTLGCRDIAYQLVMNNPGRRFKVSALFYNHHSSMSLTSLIYVAYFPYFIIKLN